MISSKFRSPFMTKKVISLSFSSSSIFSSIRFHSTSISLNYNDDKSELSKLKSLDPPYTPVFKDERQKYHNDGFKVLCRCCRQQIFDDSVILKGNPAWPTFCAVSNVLYDGDVENEDNNNESNTIVNATNLNVLQRRDNTNALLRLSVDELSQVIREGHSQLSQRKNNSGEGEDVQEDDEVTRNHLPKNSQKKVARIADQDRSNKKLTESEKFDLELQSALQDDEKKVILTAAMSGNDDDDASLGGMCNKKKSSLILTDAPPTMRWGIQAPKTLPEDYVESHAEKVRRRMEEKQHRKEFRGRVNTSKQLSAASQQMAKHDGRHICRGFCSNCDTFICVVFAGSAGEKKGSHTAMSAASPITGQKFVCNPSSIILTN